jgi:hypothetical protein
LAQSEAEKRQTAAASRSIRTEEAKVNEDVFNTSIRKFLKMLGVTAQREIEKAVREALADGRVKGNETWPAKAVVTIGGLDFALEINGQIELE